MKISDVCRQYGFDENDLKAFLKEKKLLKETWTSYVIEDSNVDKAVRMYAEFKAQQEEEAAAERRDAEKKKRHRLCQIRHRKHPYLHRRKCR